MFTSKAIAFFAAVWLIAAGCSTSRSTSSSSGDAIDLEPWQTENPAADFDPNERSPYVADAYNPSKDRTHDLLHTALTVSFDWAQARMNGEATLKLTPYFYPTSSVTLDAKGFDLLEIALLGEGGAKTPLQYQYDNWKLTIALGREYKRGEEYQLYIRYTAKPNELPEGGSEAITEEKGLYFINPDGADPDKPTQVWTQGETESSSCWFPTFDQGNERTTQEMYITVADKYLTLSNGELRSQTKNEDGTRTDYWVMDKPHAPYLFMMAVGEFARVEDRWRDKIVDYYVDPEYEPYARQIFGNTPQMLEFYSNKLGVVYPWSKYSQVVVEDFVSGAMENTTAVIHYDGLNQTDRELLDGNNESIIAHEAFHQWFGDLVTCESWANLPLNESFATYGEYLWFEHKYGRERADMHLNDDLEVYLDESAMKQEPLIRFGYDDKEDMFDSHSYQKGGRVLHMLRKLVGDEAFFAGLQKYLSDHAYTAVEMHEFRMAMEDVVGQDLNWFFNQWFYSPGHPELAIDYSQEAGSGKWVVTISQVQQQAETPVYRIPLDIDVYVNGGVKRQRVELDRRQQDFVLDVINPEWINVDAEKMILGVITDNKPEEWYVSQLESGPLFLDRAEAVAYFGELASEDSEANAELVKAFDDSFWAVQEMALDAYAIEENTSETIRAKMLDLTQNHKKSDVRVAAMRNLGGFEDRAYLPVFEAALGDSSWRVVSNAIREMGRLDGELALRVAAGYEDSKNLNVTIAILDVYAKHGGADKNATFVAKLQELNGWEQYLVMESYGEYLARLEDHATVIEGCKALAQAAATSEIWWMSQVAQGAITNVVTSYETQKEALTKADKDFAAKTAALESGIKDLESILEEMTSN